MARVEDAAQWVETWPSMDKVLGSILHGKIWAWWCIPEIPELWRWRQEDENVKVILEYTVSFI